MSEFEAQDDNAFMLLNIDGSNALQARFDGGTQQLVDGERLRYTSEHFQVEIAPESLEVTVVKTTGAVAKSELFEPVQLGAMITLLRSFSQSVPEFPVLDAEDSWLVIPNFNA